MLVCELMISAVSVITPLFQSYAIDNFIGKNTLDGLTWFIVAYSVVVLLSSALQYVETRSGMNLEMFLLRDMRRATFNKLQTLSVAFFNVNSVGVLHARVMSDTEKIGGTVVWDGNHGIRNIVYVVGAVAVMFSLNALLALCVLTIVPLIVLTTVFFQRKLIRLNRKEREINAKLTAGFNEGITGAPTTKSLAIESKLDTSFYLNTREMKAKSLQLVHYRSLFYSIITFASSLALAAVLWYGGVITLEQLIGIGTLSVFMTYAQGLVAPVQWAIYAIADILGVKVNLERVTALLNTESDVKDTPEVIEKYGDGFNHKRENWEKIEGDVEFENVSFKYPDGEEYVLENFNLKVPRGTNVAIVGETGAGKSTLVNLLCRFYEPTLGRVLIDGRDVRERSVGWLHANIGYVLQSPHLFSGTVRENLLYGKADATEEELAAAIKSVNADKVIDKLENGLDSFVGEGGGTLSTGEKQLISFARAILADPALFILDEATSSIDTLTEKLVQDAVEKLMENRTSFIIAHRLSTVKTADIILVVDGGKIIERGTHSELLKQKGHYYNLYLKQFKEENEK
ncbi:MAG: ABC transporter ATP-binding protein/permease [Clostridia bacterium]|nr:ABC transporter ATP-binding protein/permease [Clostridia bacterium]